MDYLKALKKIETKQVKTPTVFREPESPFAVNNRKYDAEINRLLNINNEVNKIAREHDIRPLLLLDRMRLKVMSDNFRKTADETGIDNKILKFFKFNTYCGSGTNILERDLNPNFANNYIIDQICKKHDFAYTRAKIKADIITADIEMIKEIVDNYFINNLFQTKEKLDALENFKNHIMSLETLGNLFKVYGMGTVAKDVAKGFLYDLPLSVIGYRKNMNFLNEQFQSGDEIDREMVMEMLEEQGVSAEDVGNILQATDLKQTIKGLAGTSFSFAKSAIFTSLFKDTGLAMIGMTGILFKLFYENVAIPSVKTITGYDIPHMSEVWRHEYNPEDIADLVKQFQDIQNERLEKAGYEPIDIINMTPETPIQQTPIIGVPIPETEPQTEPIKDINEDIYDITDIPFSVETETLNELNKYIENLE